MSAHRTLDHRPSRIGLALALGLCAAAAHGQSLSYLGQQIVPSGTVFAGTTVGGLSGIDYDAGTGRYVAISDDRSALNPARFYGLTLDLSKFTRSATPGDAGVQFESVTTILQPGGLPFATNTLDPESIRRNPIDGRLVWTNEGQRTAGGFQQPTVRAMTPAGAHVKDFAVPARYVPAGSAAGTTAGDSGIFNNLAFESLTFSTDGRTVYTATENGLTQDGPPAGIANGSPARILAFDAATGAAGAEYVYGVTPVALPPSAPGGFATNGLVELLATGDRQFLALERSFAVGAASPGVGPNGLPTGYTVKLYAVDARAATDVSGLDALSAGSFTPVKKTLLLDFADLRNDDGSVLALDNLEGMSFGPTIGGQRTLIVVSDNNFGSTQFTQFVALQVSNVPEPASAALMLAGLGGLVLTARRRR